MNRDNFHDKNLKKWCQDNGWTNLFIQGGQLYAFPPGAVIPLPLPTVNLESTKNIRESKARILRLILLANLPISLVFIFICFSKITFGMLLTELIILNLSIMLIRVFWIWFSFLQLWFNSR